VFRDLPRGVWVLLVGTFVNRFGTFVMPFLALYLTRGGFSAARAGIAVAAYGGGHFFASMIGGHLADRVGRRNTIVVSMISSAVMMLVLSQARAYAAILVLTFLAGTAAEMYRPASFALLADLLPESRRTTGFALYRFAVNLGMAAGPATAGFLADRSFLLVFLGDAATSATYAVIALIALPHGLRTYTKDEQVGEATRVALRDRALVMYLTATALMTIVDFQFLCTLPLFVRSLGHPNSVFGLLVSLNGILIICFELPLTAVIRRFNVLGAIAFGYFLLGLGYFVNVGSTLPALALGVAIWTFGEMIYAPLGATYIAMIAPEKYRGRYMGIWSMSWAVGMIVGPALGTLLYARSPIGLWIACGIVGCLSAAIMLRERLKPRATSR